ncbi:MAG: acetolactate synthase small subunit [Omnitrophica WOR_2 bacterium GWF2_38_59]|nr:MAG: acetolactate synthase small subunit [Omnitrophica WOR_2 bacterium GWA2_37_7]OGX23053.1 MAG: acetolactate synthase small subunit [Omnitrophica WOR_2 bacterium GWF2_38_59]OGX51249.1 MAG: acetolactate synthase small subunit [Omnitrophica WOR_2 bacterium RIFOXYA2_FULL_38_17]OGX54348.1 MAG: acetolactate synthase small subunit [Omnitrophica WOR_2 bacterium RIFOXYA12_FULL_38_10]OGX55370.1 MAG: acetolactate synthase small subunit [Omnitrophica WOR_2 bacterium RIFOXYB2_FULL_38_16]OGX57958.1 MAG
MKTKDKSNIHTISFLVANKPGVLVRVALVFARRGYNIDSLVVSPSLNEKFSRMTITAQGDPEILDQIIKQASKLVDVICAGEHSEEDAVAREMMLVKVKYTSTSKAIILKQVKKYQTSIIDEDDNTIIISQIGTTDDLDEFEEILKKHVVIEMVRSGKLVMVKGQEST